MTKENFNSGCRQDSKRNPYKVFHSVDESIREKIHVVLVRPENPLNVGAAARALGNMGLRGKFCIVGAKDIITADAERMSKHAQPRLLGALHFEDLPSCLKDLEPEKTGLAVGATARVGSAQRPHPVQVREAMTDGVNKLRSETITSLTLVFGPESSGLNNEEIASCDWVVTIPSSPDYRSLNLAQSILIFGYEVHLNLLQKWEPFKAPVRSQKERLILHLHQLAEKVGFVLPGDPYKMKPRLENIFSHLPNHVNDVKTLHGFIEQIVRTVETGKVEYKGRYRHKAEPPAHPPLEC